MSRTPHRSSVGKSSVSALNFFAEAGLLKRVKRSGWWVAGIENPETVAEHCFRCAVIGYYLAHMEGVDPFQVTVMALFNDIHEARINDLHKMGHFYIEFKDAERKVFREQMRGIDPAVGKELKKFREDYDRQQTRESIVARDADILECLVQAKEYHDHGFKVARKFFRIAPGLLKSRSAKILWARMRTWDSSIWWESVVKFDR